MIIGNPQILSQIGSKIQFNRQLTKMDFSGMNLAVTQIEKKKFVSYVWSNIVKQPNKNPMHFSLGESVLARIAWSLLWLDCLQNVWNWGRLLKVALYFFLFISYHWKRLESPSSNLVTGCCGHDCDQWFIAVFCSCSDYWNGLELFSRLLNNDNLLKLIKNNFALTYFPL